MEQIVQELRYRQNSMRHRFEGWRKLQDGISSQWSRIEFRRAGAITYNLFDKSLGIEKAVDVKLATDLIVLREIYDVAVIIEFVEQIWYSNGKKAYKSLQARHNRA